MFDDIYRVIEFSDSYEITHVEHTETFAQNLHGLLQENRVLKESLGNLWKTHLYNQEYIAYLLGTYTREEFREIAEQHAATIRECNDPNHLRVAVDVLLSILSGSLFTTDLSILLNYSPSCIEDNLRQIEYRPEDIHSD